MKEIMNVSGRIFEVDGPLTAELRAQTIQSINSRISRMSPATCPSSVIQNSTHTVTINATGGVAPYTYTLLLDGAAKAGSTPIPDTTWTTSVNFGEAIGPHTLAGRVVDSCGAQQTATDQCTSFSIVAPTTGSIICTSTPSGASVTLDGVSQGVVTPFTLTNILAGSHTVTFNLAGYNSCSQTVSVIAGSTVNASCTLTIIPTTGSISCTSTPTGAQIWLDGVNTTYLAPATLTNVSPGSRSVTFKLTAYQDCTQTVSVTAGSTVNASCTLTLIPTTGSISCTSIPSGASITLDGVNQGVNTPATITGVPAGSHTITFNLAGYNSCPQTISVIAGSTVNASCTLVLSCSPLAATMTLI